MLKFDPQAITEAMLECENRALKAVWWEAEALVESFEERREAFLFLLGKLLESERFRLQDFKTNQPLTGSIDEQLKLFDEAMPRTGEEVDSLLFDKSKYPPEAWPHDLGTGVLMDFWFAGEEDCPGYAVWLSEAEGGTKEWVIA